MDLGGDFEDATSTGGPPEIPTAQPADTHLSNAVTASQFPDVPVATVRLLPRDSLSSQQSKSESELSPSSLAEIVVDNTAPPDSQPQAPSTRAASPLSPPISETSTSPPESPVHMPAVGQNVGKIDAPREADSDSSDGDRSLTQPLQDAAQNTQDGFATKRGRGRGRGRGRVGRPRGSRGGRTITPDPVEISDQSSTGPKTRRLGKTAAESRRFFANTGALNHTPRHPPVTTPLAQRIYRSFPDIKEVTPLRTSITLQEEEQPPVPPPDNDAARNPEAVHSPTRRTITFKVPSKSTDEMKRAVTFNRVTDPDWSPRALRKSQTPPPAISKLKVQNEPCSRFSDAAPCVNCYELLGPPCRFHGMRWFSYDLSGRVKDGPFFMGTTVPDLNVSFLFDFLGDPTRQQVMEVFLATSDSIMLNLDSEKAAIFDPGAVRCQKDSSVVTTCDACLSGTFASFWLCRRCGRRLCSACLNDLDHRDSAVVPHPQICIRSSHHQREHFVPCVFFDICEIDNMRAAIQSIRLQVASHPSATTSADTATFVNQLVPRTFPVERLSDETFRQFWVKRCPFVVANLPITSNLWTPATLRTSFAAWAVANEQLLDANRRDAVAAVLELLQKGIKLYKKP
ncbi:hypothetical protein BT69DRAFT_114634 [Atractiella rhizophila]|nr:hypothetical protein BT69DRAFT_114634 [Atractiella rhizophila]